MKTITCAMCGHEFDPAGHQRCSSCPIQKGCQLVCCPECGYETINIHQSRLVQMIAKFFPQERPKDAQR